MSLVDQFESVFRSSIRELFKYKPIAFRQILFVTDLADEKAEDLLKKTQSFLSVLADDKPSWEMVREEDFQTTEDLLGITEKIVPDLICSYRNLKSRAWRFPHSLGEHLDVLLQKTTPPVLVIPHPEAGYARVDSMKDTKTVMAVTDQLSSDHELVNYAVRFTAEGGRLFLTHIEDGNTFERYMEAISKIPTIDTRDARDRIAEQLLKSPREFIESCKKEIVKADLPITVEEIIVFGNRLSEYRKHIEEKEIDLLVMHTKNRDQLAMNGLSYPLAVELRSIPLLML